MVAASTVIAGVVYNKPVAKDEQFNQKKWEKIAETKQGWILVHFN